MGHRRDLFKEAMPNEYWRIVEGKPNSPLWYLGHFTRSVDTFFACSGILVAQSFLRSFDK